jgi:glycosyltransferase involved in cell wall biosynthesis
MNILVMTHSQAKGFITTPFIDDLMKAHVKRGCRVRAIVAVPQGKANRFDRRIGRTVVREGHNGVEYVFVRYISLSRYGEKAFNVRSFTKVLGKHLPEILEDFRPDIIHAHTVLFDGRVGLWLKEHTGAPLVVTTHGGDIVKPLRRGWGSILKETCDKADAVAADSSALGRKCALFHAEKEAVPVTLGYASDTEIPEVERIPKRLIQVSGFVPSKHIAVTIQAFKILHGEDPEYQLFLIGDGPLRPEMEALSAELGVRESVHFLGRMPNARVLEEMARSTYFVMVSSPEGLGVVYIEAMSQGCLAIGTIGEGVADIIEDGVNGYLLPVDRPDLIADRIRACEQDPALRERLSAAGQKKASGLTWERAAEEYEKLFRKTIGQ